MGQVLVMLWSEYVLLQTLDARAALNTRRHGRRGAFLVLPQSLSSVMVVCVMVVEITPKRAPLDWETVRESDPVIVAKVCYG